MNLKKIQEFGTTENHQTKRKVMRLIIRGLELCRLWSKTNDEIEDGDKKDKILQSIDAEIEEICEKVADYFELEIGEDTYHKGFNNSEEEHECLLQIFEIVKQKYPQSVQYDDVDRLYIFGDGSWS